MCISGDFICSYRENKMVCDCEYAKMGEQIANEVEQMTLDERKQMAQKREEPSLMESIWGKKDTSQPKLGSLITCDFVDRLGKHSNGTNLKFLLTVRLPDMVKEVSSAYLGKEK